MTRRRADSGAIEWKPVSPLAGGVVIVLSVLVLLIHVFSAQGWVPLLDDANLALHEAGHPLVGLFSNRLMVYGGTLFQLLFPALAVVHFRRVQDAVGAAGCTAWLGENLLNIARYMADARAQVLPLVGGGEHDWTEIFTRWGMLARDVKIAGLCRGIGVLVIVAAVHWLWRRYKNQQTGMVDE